MPGFNLNRFSKFIFHFIYLSLILITAVSIYFATRISNSSAQVGTSGFLFNSYPSHIFTVNAQSGGAQWNNIAGDAYISGNVGIGGVTNPAYKLVVQGGHGDTQLLLHSLGAATPTTEADLMLWASEPGATWTGVGMGNNIKNAAGFTRINTARGGSYLRLEDSGMTFNTVTNAGGDTKVMSLIGPNLAVGNSFLEIRTDNGSSSNSNYIRGQTNHLVVNANGTLYLNYPEYGAGETRIGEALVVGRQGATTAVGRLFTNEWIQMNNYGLYSPTNGAYLYPNNGTYGAWRIAGSRNAYNGIEFDTPVAQVSLMVGLGNPIETGFHRNGVGWLWYASGSEMHASSYLGMSDARLKKNISPIETALDKVLNLQGVNFEYDNSRKSNSVLPEGKQIGFLAQDVEKIIPEVVRTDKEGYKSLDYSHLTALLNEAIKEQEKKIETQDERIDKLEKTIEDMQLQIQDLKK